jgi:hypothetical protein
MLDRQSDVIAIHTSHFSPLVRVLCNLIFLVPTMVQNLQVGRIVKASPFNKPEAIAVLLLAGLQTGLSTTSPT